MKALRCTLMAFCSWRAEVAWANATIALRALEEPERLYLLTGKDHHRARAQYLARDWARCLFRANTWNRRAWSLSADRP